MQGKRAIYSWFLSLGHGRLVTVRQDRTSCSEHPNSHLRTRKGQAERIRFPWFSTLTSRLAEWSTVALQPRLILLHQPLHDPHCRGRLTCIQEFTLRLQAQSTTIIVKQLWTLPELCPLTKIKQQESPTDTLF